MGYTSKYKSKADLEMEARELRIAKTLLRYDVPVIYINRLDDIKILGNQNAASIDSIQAGQTINLIGGFALMQSTYALNHEDLMLRNIHITDKLKFSNKDIALVTDEAIFCTRDVGYMLKKALREQGYSNDQIWRFTLKDCVSQWLVEQPKTRVDSELAIQKMVNTCIRDDIMIIGLSGADREALQLANGETNENILLKDVAVGDIIEISSNCVNQITGEPMDYGFMTKVTETCTLGNESFVFTDVGLITDADVTFQISKAYEKYYKEPTIEQESPVEEIEEIDWQ